MSDLFRSEHLMTTAEPIIQVTIVFYPVGVFENQILHSMGIHA